MTPLEFKLWRVARKLTQEECGELFCVSQPAISFWERHGLPAWAIAEVRRIEAAPVEDKIKPEGADR